MTVLTASDKGVVGSVQSTPLLAPRTADEATKRRTVYDDTICVLMLLHDSLPYARSMTVKARDELQAAADACAGLVGDLMRVDVDLASIILSLHAECLLFLCGDRPEAPTLSVLAHSEEVYSRLERPSTQARERHEANLNLPKSHPRTTRCDFLLGLIAAIERR